MFIILAEGTQDTPAQLWAALRWVWRWDAALTAAQAQLPAAVLLGDGVCQQQHLVLEAAGLQHTQLQLLGVPHSLLPAQL